MIELYDQIDIYAPKETIWEIVTDFESYPEWNPSLDSVSGKFALGETITFTLQQNNQQTMSSSMTINEIIPYERFTLQGKFIFSPLLKYRFIVSLEPIQHNKTSLTQAILFSGLLVKLLGKTYDTHQTSLLQNMNKRLKTLAEKG